MSHNICHEFLMGSHWISFQLSFTSNPLLLQLCLTFLSLSLVLKTCTTISTNQIKTKTNPDLVRHVFLHLIIVAFTNWLTMMSSLAPIDW